MHTIAAITAAVAMGLAAAALAARHVPTEPGRTAPAQLRRVLPSEANRAASPQWGEPHLVAIGPAESRRGVLVVFFPGTTGVPQQYAEFTRTAAEEGFHAITLRYANDLSINLNLCPFDVDLECFENARREIIEGVEGHPDIAVPPTDSIERRLADLLRLLDRRHPTEGWGAFVPGGSADAQDLRWERIIVAGHSQGGGHAAYIATTRWTRGALLFAGGLDRSALYQVQAPWMSGRETLPSRYAGFVHIDDRFPAFRGAWTTLGLDAFGPLVQAEGAEPPYFGANRLFSAAEPPAFPPDNWAHRVIIVDENLPRDEAGVPVFRPVWAHMLDRAATSCVADLAPPEGVLDQADLQAAIQGVNAGLPVFDLAEPVGVVDLNDLEAWLREFDEGCR